MGAACAKKSGATTLTSYQTRDVLMLPADKEEPVVEGYYRAECWWKSK